LERQSVISFRLRDAMEDQMMAMSGFEILGNEMTPLVPGLINLFCSHSKTQDPSIAYVAEACLASIGPPAVPELLPLLTNQDRAVSDRAATVVASIVPRLTYLLKTDANETNRWQMVVELAEIKTRGNVTALTDQTVATNGQRVTEEFEGALTNALKDTSFLVRSAATNALKRIDSEAASEAGVK
jgi:HEAT repeat protein